MKRGVVFAELRDRLIVIGCVQGLAGYVQGTTLTFYLRPRAYYFFPSLMTYVLQWNPLCLSTNFDYPYVVWCSNSIPWKQTKEVREKNETTLDQALLQQIYINTPTTVSTKCYETSFLRQ
jgi:hypothetical protein